VSDLSGEREKIEALAHVAFVLTLASVGSCTAAISEAQPLRNSAHGVSATSVPSVVDGVAEDRRLAARARSAAHWSTPEIISLPSGDFFMGTSSDGVEHARFLCERETATHFALAWRCAGLLDSLEGAALGPLCDRSNFEFVTFREEGEHVVFLNAYLMDRTEVSVRNYWQCVSDGACTEVRVLPGSVPLGASDHPVVGVSWYQAREYCRWRHGRLPSEAEWERGARGRDGRIFPWGNQFNPRLANVGMTSATCLSSADGYDYTAPVDSFRDGRSVDGFVNMSGNVAEWVDDIFDDGPEDPATHRPQWRNSRSRYHADIRIINPHVTEARDDRRVFRGGSFASQSFQARTTFRARISAGEQVQWLGFRCAYDQ
jgi:formylglycine-generating enzyme required for sulfatase activity